MITATIYKQGDDSFLLWSFDSRVEENILRILLGNTNTRIGYQITHFTTKIDINQLMAMRKKLKTSKQSLLNINQHSAISY
jgi:hypothetical protein